MEISSFLFVFLLHLLVVISSPANEFSDLLNQRVLNFLKIDEFEKFYRSLPTRESTVNQTDQAYHIKFNYESKIKQNNNMLKAWDKELSSGKETVPMPRCPTDENSQGYVFDPVFKLKVNKDTLCVLNGNEANVPKDLVTIAKNNLIDGNGVVSWQYFATEDGYTFNYPAFVRKENVDMRFRPWYISTTSQKSKHVILLVQSSDIMNGVKGVETVWKVILESLNPLDNINVFTFSSSTVELCQLENKASRYLIDKFESYLSKRDIAGDTNYTRAFKTAFDKFSNSTKLYKVLFVLSKCKGVELESENLKNVIIKGEETNKNKVKLIILCFTEPDETSKTSWSSIISTTNWNLKYGEALEPVIDFNKTEATISQHRSAMPYYFKNYLLSTTTEDIFYTNPYFDILGFGLVMTTCKIFSVNREIRGVICVDNSVENLFGDIRYFYQNISTYSFLVNGKNQVILHPYVNPSVSSSQEFYLPDITDIEKDSDGNIFDLKQCITERQTNCSMIINSTRVYSRGFLALQGIASESVLSSYICLPLSPSTLTVCLVYDVDLKQIDVIDPLPTVQSFLFMNELLPESFNRTLNTCSQRKRLSTPDQTSITLSPMSFVDPYTYLLAPTNASTINNWKKCVSSGNEAEHIFKPGVREAIIATAKAEELWKTTNLTYDNIVWRHIATKEGVFRKFPGSRMPQNYDATQRPWYLLASAELGNIAVSGPSSDISLTGCYISFSKAIPIKSGSKSGGKRILASMNIMIDRDYVQQNFLAVFKDCQNQNYNCSVVDRSGFIKIRSASGKITSECDKETHITCEEKDVSGILIKENILQSFFCMDYGVESNKITKFWEIKLDVKSRDFKNFQIYSISNTNVFVIVKNSTGPDQTTCRCTYKETGNPSCNQPLDTLCEYPCFYERDMCDLNSWAINTSTIFPCVFTPVLPNPEESQLIASEAEVVSRLCPCSNLNCTSTGLTITDSTTTTATGLSTTGSTATTATGLSTTSSTTGAATGLSTTSSTTISTTNTASSSLPAPTSSIQQIISTGESPQASNLPVALGIGIGLSLGILLIIFIVLFVFKDKLKQCMNSTKKSPTTIIDVPGNLQISETAYSRPASDNIDSLSDAYA